MIIKRFQPAAGLPAGRAGFGGLKPLILLGKTVIFGGPARARRAANGGQDGGQ